MNILVDINHPAHVHMYRHPISRWKAAGHEVLVIARDKDVTIKLLQDYGIDFEFGSRQRSGVLGLALELLTRTLRLLRWAWVFKPDVLTSVASPTAAIASMLLRRPHVAFDDTEQATLGRSLYLPFTERVYTPRDFRLDLGKKQQRYDSYQELSYLHPNVFTPNSNVLSELGLSPYDYVVLRFVHFNAAHDFSPIGFSLEQKRELVAYLSMSSQVLLSEEGQIAIEHEAPIKRIPEEHFHDFLAFARLCVTEGGTTATEAALLGTPVVLLSHVSSGNWDELEQDYGLLFHYRDSEAAMEKSKQLFTAEGNAKQWKAKQEKLLANKADMSEIVFSAVLEAIN